MKYLCAVCGCPYLLWADGLHHDERDIDAFHEVQVGEMRPQVDERLLPPRMRPQHTGR